jgi:superfamily II DNA/RNA helicase
VPVDFEEGHGLEIALKIPDLWQQEAVRHLQAGRDVVVHAPTGAGKTFIFELLLQDGWRRQAVFTVPTRALANDKLYEWRSEGWNVGIATGDVADNLDAPVVIATLETQKGRFLRGDGPGFLVIDEYQMLGDPVRGVNYELILALAKPSTQLLLLSGSVANPEKTVAWLRRIGRDAVLVHHAERPVPQEELELEALPDRVPASIRGFWPRLIARALMADLGPILVFAPRRRAAEELAFRLAGALPLLDLLTLTSEQKALASDRLGKLLKHRIAFHHSGLNYQQRAGLIEPLAKAGQLRVVVATTGLAAGINFSMKSVLVTDREYVASAGPRQVRPDELLQMFGRAGRRGLDDKGYVLVAPSKPRLAEARPLQLKRANPLDWPSFLALMHQTVLSGESPALAAADLARRLFTDHAPELGLEAFLKKSAAPTLQTLNASAPQRPVTSTASTLQPFNASTSGPAKIVEMLNSAGQWERRRPHVKVKLGESLAYQEGAWIPALKLPQSLATVNVGNLCRLQGEDSRYGRQVALAVFPKESGQSKVTLVKWMHKSLSHHWRQTRPGTAHPPRHWDLGDFEKQLVPLLPQLTSGGRLAELIERNGLISARLDYSQASVLARVDSLGKPLLNPPRREIEPPPADFALLAGMKETASAEASVAETWHRLGLIDARARPTRRGVIFSFFNHGEGLAIAAALEDDNYPVAEIIRDLANLRAGHRFEAMDHARGRLGSLCRLTYHGLTCPGYLRSGVPLEYGDGAAEVLAHVRANPAVLQHFLSETLRPGDIERAALEWRSLLNHVAHAPDYDWSRWRDLRAAAIAQIEKLGPPERPAHPPELTPAQRLRHHFRLKF